MAQSGYKTLEEKRLKEFCIKLLVQVKVPFQEAEIVADSLVSADLRGVGTHRIISLPRYVSLIQSGAARPVAKIEVIKDFGAMTLWDGCGSLGQVLGVRAMQKCLEKAREHGTGTVGVRKSNHFGACAYYAMKAVQEDMIGIAMTTASPTMAPWGGCEPMLGNNPFAVAIPCKNELPVVLDISQSVVSGMKLHLMKKEGKNKIPAGWALDKEGKFTENLDDAIKNMLLAPLEKHKGYGIALVIDVLSGILLGAGYGHSATDGKEGPGHLFIAFNIGAFRELEEFKEAMDGRIKELKACKLAKGAERIFMPGEIEFETEEKREKEGIPVLQVIVNELNQLAETIGCTDHL